MDTFFFQFLKTKALLESFASYKSIGIFLSPSLFEEHFEVVYQAVRIVVNNNYLDVMYASGMQKKRARSLDRLVLTI